MNDFTRIKRLTVIVFSFAVCYVLQMLVLPGIPYLKAVPNLVLIEVISFGFLYGKKTGVITGAIAGLIMDTLGSGTPGFYTLIFSWIGYLNGRLSEKMDSELIIVLYIFLAANELLFHAYVFVFGFLIGRHFSLSVYLSKILLPELFLTMIAFIIVYGILLSLSNRLEIRVNKGEIRIV